MGARRVKRYRLILEQWGMPILLTLIRQKATSHGRPLRLGFLPLGWIHLGLTKAAGGSACTLANWIGEGPRCDFDFSSYRGMPSAFWGAHRKVREFCSVRFRPVRFAQASSLFWRGGLLREWIWHPFLESLPICRPMTMQGFFTKLWVFFRFNTVTICLIENPNYYLRTPVHFLHADPFCLVATCLPA